MSFLYVLDSSKDAEKVKALIEEASTVLTGKIVPAIQAAGDEMVDRLAERIKEVVADANTKAMEDWKAISADLATDLRATLGELTALLSRLDGAQVTVKLGESK